MNRTYWELTTIAVLPAAGIPLSCHLSDSVHIVTAVPALERSASTLGDQENAPNFMALLADLSARDLALVSQVWQEFILSGYHIGAHLIIP